MQGRKWLILVAAGALAACASSRQNTRTGTGSGASGPAATGQADDARQRAEQRAAQEAPSVHPQEGLGGRDPRPLPTGQGDQARYGEATPPEANAQGRVPDSRLPSAPGAAGSSPTSGSEVSGRVLLVDQGEHEIAIDSGTVTTQVKVADSAKVMIDGRQGSLSDLRQGTMVRARLDRSGEEPQVTQIDVLPSTKKK